MLPVSDASLALRTLLVSHCIVSRAHNDTAAPPYNTDELDARAKRSTLLSGLPDESYHHRLWLQGLSTQGFRRARRPAPFSLFQILPCPR